MEDPLKNHAPEAPKQVEHMVWARFKPGVSPEEADRLVADVAAMARQVEGVLDVKAGRNFTGASGGHTHGWTLTLRDREALQAYGEHPAHRAIAGPLLAAAELLKMDIEFTP